MVKKILHISVLLTVLLLNFTSCHRKVEKSFKASKIENRIFDNADLLSNEQEKTIFRLIKDLEDSIGSQIAILTLDTLNGEDINQYSLRMFEDLALGREKYKDGILITVAYRDRKTRIEVGYGLEKIIKDEVASRIIREEMVPKFKEQKVYEGLYGAVSVIKKSIEENRKIVGQMP
ncbi:MAG TPA: TPM domain-containing protein [Chryseolinea sp.]